MSGTSGRGFRGGAEREGGSGLGAAAGEAEADGSGEAEGEKADEGEDGKGGDEGGDEQEEGGGGGAEDGVDEGGEDADEGHGWPPRGVPVGTGRELVQVWMVWGLGGVRLSGDAAAGGYPFPLPVGAREGEAPGAHGYNFLGIFVDGCCVSRGWQLR